MAWIESHQSLERHPKRIKLSNAMGWDLDTTIGKLHRFWWWCVDYAEDGGLEGFSDNDLGLAVALNGEDAKKFVETMDRVGFIDRIPYFRVHDWWSFAGKFLYSKYHTSNPKKLESIRRKWIGNTKGYPKGNPKDRHLTNITKPNQPNLTKKKSDFPEIPGDLLKNQEDIKAWLQYKREKGQTYKPSGLNALWGRLRAIPEVNRASAIQNSMANNYSGVFESQKKQEVSACGKVKPDPGKYDHL